ncbi:MAG: response regulator transcription factor, partial [Gaiellaceae bacterium]
MRGRLRAARHARAGRAARRALAGRGRQGRHRCDRRGADRMNETIRVLIVDDHAVVRSGLRRVLEAEGGFEVVGEAGDMRNA